MFRQTEEVKISFLDFLVNTGIDSVLPTKDETTKTTAIFIGNIKLIHLALATACTSLLLTLMSALSSR